MDFTLRCNALKCRSQLTDRAVVTTCSHIFCINCSNRTGILNNPMKDRICPACETRLVNADDIVATSLNPSEDYKTSVLSGLNPSSIMECAGRGLNFYAYQATQEILYQEYLSRSLTEKHNQLSSQLDQVIHDANLEIVNLRNKVAALQSEQEDLHRKNSSLREAYNEKVRQHQKGQAAFDKLKKRLLESDVQMVAAAEDAIEQSLYKDTHGQSFKQYASPLINHYPTASSLPRQQSAGSYGSSRHIRHHQVSPASPHYPKVPVASSEIRGATSRHRTRLPLGNQAPAQAQDEVHSLFHNNSMSRQGSAPR